ncbi:LysR family transcriptional regulator [Pseudonocardia tropica]|uniref:LysR family transcriptional regulator n=1 Tax=Pseudonocardia tropica TaxID=681289 RepID=A0ABV1K100_9PSEU
MNLERLRALHAVATYGSISVAAQALCITASAASQQLSKLEREMGDRLLERDGRGVRLTDSGQLLARHAEQILASVERARAEVERHRGTVHGDLTIAAFATAVRGLIPDAVARLDTRYPRLNVRIVEYDPHRALPQLLRGAVDLVVNQYCPSNPFVLPDGLSGETVLVDTVDLAVPAGHRLAEQSSVTVDDLHDERWISWPQGSSCHQWLLGVLRGHGIEPRIAHEAAEHPTQLALVAAGLGVGVVPRLGRGEVPAAVRFLPFRPTVERHVQAVWRTGGDQRPALRAALTALVVAPD